MTSIASIPEVETPATSRAELILLFRVRTGESPADTARGGSAIVGSLYGCAIGDAQEIVPLRPMTRVPGAPRYVRGLINMRGLIVTVIDLGCRLDPARIPAERGAILLVRHGGTAGAARGPERLVGVVVDEVVDVRPLEIRADDWNQPGNARGIVRGIATLDDAPVVVLDFDALVRQVLLS